MIRQRGPIGVWLWTKRFHMQMRWWRLRDRLDWLCCRVGGALALRDPTACRGCGTTDLDGWDPSGQNTWCVACCPDHDYRYDLGRRDKYCIRCGEPEPWDLKGP